MEGKSKFILELCDSWKKANVDGGNTTQYRLLDNQINFHDLTFEELQATCIGLTNTLLLKGLNIFIVPDHLFFWAWSAEVVINKEISNRPQSKNERDIISLFTTCIRASLVSASQQDYLNLEVNTRELVMKNSIIQAYLSFPLLEAVLKKSCKEYVDYAGKVLKDFRVNGRWYKINGRISSLRDLLLLFYNQVADDHLKKIFSLLRSYLEDIQDPKDNDPFDVIYRWRNSSLHGQEGYTTVGGTVLNIAILILLNELKDEYNQIKEFACRGINHVRDEPIKPHWSFYPPC